MTSGCKCYRGVLRIRCVHPGIHPDHVGVMIVLDGTTEEDHGQVIRTGRLRGRTEDFVELHSFLPCFCGHGRCRGICQWWMASKHGCGVPGCARMHASQLKMLSA